MAELAPRFRCKMAASIGTDVKGKTHPKELEPSQMGTKEYWESTYSKFFENFKDNGDVGDVWYGYESVERLVSYLEEHPLVSMDNSVLDLGCGNGVTLVELKKAGFSDLTGIDYSQSAINLAKAVAKDEELDIKYECCDFLEDAASSNSSLSREYDICIDKGTFDAISLTPESPELQRKKYLQNITKLLKTNGLFILTSCNWTEEELKEHFSKSFKCIGKVPTPTFFFGGKSGTTETVLVFVKQTAKSD